MYFPQTRGFVQNGFLRFPKLGDLFKSVLSVSPSLGICSKWFSVFPQAWGFVQIGFQCLPEPGEAFSRWKSRPAPFRRRPFAVLMVRHVLHHYSFLVFNIGLNAKLQKIPQTRPNTFRFYNFFTKNTPPIRKETEVAIDDFRFSILIFGELAPIPRCLSP